MANSGQAFCVIHYIQPINIKNLQLISATELFFPINNENTAHTLQLAGSQIEATTVNG